MNCQKNKESTKTLTPYPKDHQKPTNIRKDMDELSVEKELLTCSVPQS